MPPASSDYLALFKTSLYSGTEIAPTNSYLYRPLLMMSLALDYRLAGNSYDPFAFHLTNVILFSLSVVVVFLLLRTMLAKEKDGLIAVLTAALFMLFPSHIESVCNVKNREEILAFLFGGISWCLLLVETRGRILQAVVPLIIAPLLFLLALLSKESALLFLPGILIWHFRPGHRAGARGVMPVWLPSMAVVTALYLLMRHRALGSWLGGPDASAFFGPGEGIQIRVLTAARIMMKYYFWDQLLSLRLDPSFSSRFILPVENPPTIAGVACLAVIVGALGVSVWKVFRAGSLWAFWLLYFFIHSFFAWHIVRLGTAGAFRLMFTPSLALCVLPALALVESGRRTASRIAGARGRAGTIGMALFLPVALYYGSTTLKRMPIWNNDGTIYAYSATVGGDNPMSDYAAGQHYGNAHQGEMKLEYYARALRVFMRRQDNPALFDERATDAFSVVATEVAFGEVNSNPRHAVDLANLAIRQFEKLQVMRRGRVDPNIAGPYYVKALAYRNLGDSRRSVETCRAGLAITQHEGLKHLLGSMTREK